MTTTEHLLVILAEECAEVAQRATKALRFGLAETQPGQPDDNARRLMDELVDLRIALILLQEEGALPLADMTEETVERKKAKVRKFMAYSQTLGVLDESNSSDHPRGK